MLLRCCHWSSVIVLSAYVALDGAIPEFKLATTTRGRLVLIAL